MAEVLREAGELEESVDEVAVQSGLLETSLAMPRKLESVVLS